jgi:hypothetical protein
MGGFLGSLTGANQADAAKEAAAAQERMAREGMAYRKEQSGIAREDFEPYAETGRQTLGGLQDLVNDPNAQLNYVQNNPFFEAMRDQASNTLMQNQAAKGKLGSGQTAEALQNSLLSLGTNLVNQSVAQRQGLANMGFNASTNQAGISERLGGNIASDLQGIGNVQGAGLIGAANARAAGAQNLLNTGIKVGGMIGGAVGGGGAGGVAACDIRLKKDIIKVGKLDSGLPLYSFKYKNDPKEQIHINVMAQDVEKVKPEAVHEINGFKHVNLEKIWH